MDRNRPHHSDSTSLWIFGYGSLVWNPGFQYKTTRKGFVKGFARKFWQGNTVQRGTPDKPGRVATLVEEEETLTWGRAFQLGDESSLSALEYLNHRESALGGYKTHITSFHPVEDKQQHGSFPVLLYVATCDNPFYLGPASLVDMADQIFAASGDCGYNFDYVLRLAEFMHNEMPEAHDEHLFTLEHLLKARLKERNGLPDGPKVQELLEQQQQQQQQEGAAEGGGANAAAPEARPGSFQFTTTLPPKDLRCLKV